MTNSLGDYRVEIRDLNKSHYDDENKWMPINLSEIASVVCTYLDTNISYWDEDGNTSREIEFSHLESQPLIEELKSRGWEAAGYIGGLLTYSQSDIEHLPKNLINICLGSPC